MTRQELERIFCLKKELIMWQDRLRELQYDIALSPKVLDGMPFQHTNTTSDPTQQKALRLAEVSNVIQGKIAEIQFAIAEIEEFIISIDDSLIRMIVEYRCVMLMKWDEIAIELGDGYTEESVRQTYHRFVKDL